MVSCETRYDVDKITQHGYQRFYEPYLRAYRGRKITLLEIGVDAGRSLEMWLDMFPLASIYGLDIDREYAYARGKVFKGDQRSRKDLERIAGQVGQADIIVDDGSHKPEHQLYTFNYAFDLFRSRRKLSARPGSGVPSPFAIPRSCLPIGGAHRVPGCPTALD
jgi:hypothetical protein